MKYLATSLLLLVTATVAFSGVTGFLSQKTQNWSFIQAVGGMEVSVKENNLIIDCHVSGTKKVTVEPTLINSALGVRKVKCQRVGNIIQLRLVTSVIEKGMSSSWKSIDISAYPAGIYTVQYIDSDGTAHPLGKITLAAKKKGE